MRLTLKEKETHKCIAVMCTDAFFVVASVCCVPSFFLFYFFIFKTEKVEFKTKDLSLVLSIKKQTNPLYSFSNNCVTTVIMALHR